MALETPVGLFVFNRPELTARVFEAISRARPRRLLIVADGPRPGRAGDHEQCAAVRAVVQRVDWPCDVQTNFSDTNLGCGRRVSSGLDWVFDRCERTIILEDDCLPGDSFFRFCDQLLDRYADNEKIMHIAGSNFQAGHRRTEASYYFSRMVHIWGWATWRRAWRHYDFFMKNRRDFLAGGALGRYFSDPRAQRYFAQKLEQTSRGRIDTWDYQWTLALWSRDGLAIQPEANLVSNIASVAEATHPADDPRHILNQPAGILEPLTHPAQVEPCRDADDFFFAHHILPEIRWSWARVARAPGNLRAILRRRRAQG